MAGRSHFDNIAQQRSSPAYQQASFLALITPSILVALPDRYNNFRRLMQLRPLSSIDDITPDHAARAALKSVYDNNIELVDLLPGVLAEAHRPDW